MVMDRVTEFLLVNLLWWIENDYVRNYGLSNMRMKCHRLSNIKITERALLKCQQYYKDGLVAYCSPVEYVCLCWYFRIHPKEYYMNLVDQGDNSPSWQYFHVKKFDRVYPVSKYAMLAVSMSK